MTILDGRIRIGPDYDAVIDGVLMTLLLLFIYLFISPPPPPTPVFLSQSLKQLRTAEFKPYVVFVKPPSIERLRETRKNAKTISGKGDKDSSRPLTVRRRCVSTTRQSFLAGFIF